MVVFEAEPAMAPASVSRGTSFPSLFSAIVSSQPPICFPLMKTFGTVLCPVHSFRAFWSSAPSLSLSNSMAL
uniref:Uncharacterized protein n=1 Tax=Zea mays TaxID=4577 RepID=C4IZI2_MAIZE|nr:unknown [Zea mays]